MKRYLHIFLLPILALSPNLSAMEHGEVKIHVPSSSSLVDEYVAAFQQISSRSTTNLYYDAFTSMLKKEAETNKVFEELYQLATKDKPYIDGFKIKYLKPDSDILDRVNEQFLYHGTLSTLEVLDLDHLKAYASKTGWGIFFGRNFYVSRDYAAGAAGTSHQTWKKNPVKSVLVLRKDAGENFRRGSDVGSYDNEYVLQKDMYSLSHLRDLVFLTQADVDHFKYYFDTQTLTKQNWLKTINFYSEDYTPLKHPAIFRDFELILLENDKIFDNKKFISFIVSHAETSSKIPSLIKKLIGLSLGDLPSDNTALYLALREELSDKALELLRSIPTNVLSSTMTAKNALIPFYKKDSPLVQAIINGEDDFLKDMFSKISKEDLLVIAENISDETILDAFNKKQHTTMHLLVDNLGDFPMVLRSIAKATIQTQDESKFSIILSIMDKNPEILSMGKGGYDQSLIELLFKKSYFATMRAIAKAAPAILTHKLGRDGDFPLLLAARSADKDTFSVILEAAPSMIKAANKYGENIAHAVIERGDKEKMDIVLEMAPELFTKADVEGTTPIHTATRGNSEIFVLLAKKFPQALTLKGKSGMTPVVSAVNNRNKEAFNFFLENYPEQVIQNLKDLVERAAYNLPEILPTLAKKFKDQASIIYQEAKKYPRIDKEMLEELARLSQ